ncbi:MAG: hypothetical protein HWN68_11135 [Desulfobacterales bacterium]|nr:hypothetical protein [Desulfobacterales bacterium]
MPEKKANNIIKLTPEAKARLAGQERDLKWARDSIEVLKRLGMDVTPLEEKLTWAEDVRKTLIVEFGD